MHWLVRIIVDKLITRLFNYQRDLWSEYKRARAVKEGLDNGDSEKVEEAIGSGAAGKLSGLDGSKVRPRRTRD